ncbi:Holliday junction branch migration protein RuvA [Cruoricaptor ignavus]|nr:Holliday junction branch migration protein RuvA [Cruoricaptor ignavus]
MIYSVRGMVIEVAPTYAILEVGGIGYHIGISLQTSSQLKKGGEAFLYTRQIIREDAHFLYGFASVDEREVFDLLISVSGVGPTSAMIMLSSLTGAEIANAVSAGVSSELQKIKGIGAKTAERIIVDLRERMRKYSTTEEEISVQNDNKVRGEALSALEVLGIQRRIAEKAADKIQKQEPDISVENLIKQILKSI